MYPCVALLCLDLFCLLERYRPSACLSVADALQVGGQFVLSGVADLVSVSTAQYQAWGDVFQWLRMRFVLGWRKSRDASQPVNL